ncbi:glycosyltransferase family 2 protein [Acidomonas methanolica]|nr:glycosyltransferase family 2 protein [Acidomonas methanolica]
MMEDCFPTPLCQEGVHFLTEAQRHMAHLLSWPPDADDGGKRGQDMQDASLDLFRNWRSGSRNLMMSPISLGPLGRRPLEMLEKPWKPAPETQLSRRTKRNCDNGHVSVIVINYNYEKYVTDCLNLIVAQTRDSLSLIVIDDNSRKDDSVEKIMEWMAENKERFVPVLYLRNVISQGSSASRKAAIQHCPSKTVFIMDADNKVMLTAIAMLCACSQRSGTESVYSQFGEIGHRVRVGVADLWDVKRVCKNNCVDIMTMITEPPWVAIAGLSYIEEGQEDHDFWLKFIDKGIDGGLPPEIPCHYRVHDVSRTATKDYNPHCDLRGIMRCRHSERPAASENL